jgi:hypothetical protein
MNESTIQIEAGDMGLVIAFVLLVGGIIKNFTPIKNELIPLITWALGGLLYQWHSATRSTSSLVTPGAGSIAGPLVILIGLMALSGCARFTTTQTDISYEEGKPVRAVTTRAAAVTLFEAKSALAQFKASQTDKTQTATVGSLNQETTGTNTANAAAEFLGTLIRTAK